MVFVIAEAGVNHNGRLETAFDLIDAAASAGADAVKFQMFDAVKLEPAGERREMLRQLELSRKDIGFLRARAISCGLEFIATPFDLESLEFLAEIGCAKVKIGSADCLNEELATAATQNFDTIIVSTGMATWHEINAVYWALPGNIVFLHCVSAYPCPVEEINLLGVADADGLSDHTLSTIIPAAAVALGAEYIEKHLTIDRGMEGPDHKASLEPHEFAEMVRNIREIEIAMGDGDKRPMPCEAAVMKIREERERWRARSFSETVDTQEPSQTA